MGRGGAGPRRRVKALAQSVLDQPDCLYTISCTVFTPIFKLMLSQDINCLTPDSNLFILQQLQNAISMYIFLHPYNCISLMHACALHPVLIHEHGTKSRRTPRQVMMQHKTYRLPRLEHAGCWVDGAPATLGPTGLGPHAHCSHQLVRRTQRLLCPSVHNVLRDATPVALLPVFPAALSVRRTMLGALLNGPDHCHAFCSIIED